MMLNKYSGTFDSHVLGVRSVDLHDVDDGRSDPRRRVLPSTSWRRWRFQSCPWRRRGGRWSNKYRVLFDNRLRNVGRWSARNSEMVHGRLELQTSIACIRYRSFVDKPDRFFDGCPMDLYVGWLHVRRHWSVWLVRHDDRRSELYHEPLCTEHYTNGAVHAVELDFWRLLRFIRGTSTTTGCLASPLVV